MIIMNSPIDSGTQYICRFRYQPCQKRPLEKIVLKIQNFHKVDNGHGLYLCRIFSTIKIAFVVNLGGEFMPVLQPLEMIFMEIHNFPTAKKGCGSYHACIKVI